MWNRWRKSGWTIGSKPTLKEAKKLIALAEKRSLHAAVEFHKRYDKANLMLKDRLQSKKLGDPLYFWVEYSQRKSIPTEIFKEWAHKTSILQYLGIHYIDLLRFLNVKKNVLQFLFYVQLFLLNDEWIDHEVVMT